MKKKNLNKNFVKLVVISVFIVFLTTSANSALVYNKSAPKDNPDPPVAPLGTTVITNGEMILIMNKK